MFWGGCPPPNRHCCLCGSQALWFTQSLTVTTKKGSSRAPGGTPNPTRAPVHQNTSGFPAQRGLRQDQTPLSFKELLERAFTLLGSELFCAPVCVADARGGKCQILNCYAWVAARGGYLGKSKAVTGFSCLKIEIIFIPSSTKALDESAVMFLQKRRLVGYSL